MSNKTINPLNDETIYFEDFEDKAHLDEGPDIEGFQDFLYNKLKKENKYSDDEIYAMIDKEIEGL